MERRIEKIIWLLFLFYKGCLSFLAMFKLVFKFSFVSSLNFSLSLSLSCFVHIYFICLYLFMFCFVLFCRRRRRKFLVVCSEPLVFYQLIHLHFLRLICWRAGHDFGVTCHRKSGRSSKIHWSNPELLGIIKDSCRMLRLTGEAQILGVHSRLICAHDLSVWNAPANCSRLSARFSQLAPIVWRYHLSSI